MAQWYDISVTISSDLPVWPAFDPPLIEPIKRVAQGDTSNVSKLTMATHVSSHVDAPLHCFDGTTSVDELPLDLLIGSAYVVDMTGVDLAEIADFESRNIPEDAERLIIKTDASRLWEGEPLEGSEPTFTADVARWMVERGIRLVCVDGMAVGRGQEDRLNTHRTLLAAGIPVVECLNLTEVGAGRYELVCLPLKLRRTDGAPARVAVWGPLEE
jgi:arylformamidase